MRFKVGRIAPSLFLAWVLWSGAGSHAPHAGYEPVGSYPTLDACSRAAAQLTEKAAQSGPSRTYVCLPERVDPRPPQKALGMRGRPALEA